MDDSSTITGRPSISSPDSTSEAEALAEYRAPSVLAMIGLVLGLASPLVFVGRVLTAVPLFGAGVSLLALAKIASSNGQLSGRPAALVGLFLSVGCLCAAESRTLATQWRMANQAEPVARQWLAYLLEGETEKAFAMTTAAGRAPAGEPVEPGPPLPGPSKSPLEEFLEQPVVQSLLEIGEQAGIQLAKTEHSLRTTPYQAIVEQHFRIEPTDHEAADAPLVVAVTLEQRGRTENDLAPAWRVASYTKVAAEH